MSLTKLIVDCATGTYKEVPLSIEEIQERQAEAAEVQALQLAQETAEAARLEALASAQAKLSALGLTEEEIAALLK